MRPEIPKSEELEAKVFGIHNEKDFEEIALQVYHFQFHNNPLYGEFCRQIRRTPESVDHLQRIPFLPISFFKSHKVLTGAGEPSLVFRSSGTTGETTSSHYVKEPALYVKSFMQAFEAYFGKTENLCILGLLPSYLERKDASLVYMVDHLIRASGHPESGFYLYDFVRLSDTLYQLEKAGQSCVLFGVTFALLDFAAAHPQSLGHTKVVETGGMKGRRKELTREELHARLREDLGIAELYSEYGMTELLSQAYGKNGTFLSPPWMRVLLRDETDPLSLITANARTGAINVVDLANLYSCSFLATDDLGRLHADGSFEVLGRLDHSDIRGCSQMAL